MKTVIKCILCVAAFVMPCVALSGNAPAQYSARVMMMVMTKTDYDAWCLRMGADTKEYFTKLIGDKDTNMHAAGWRSEWNMPFEGDDKSITYDDCDKNGYGVKIDICIVDKRRSSVDLTLKYVQRNNVNGLLLAGDEGKHNMPISYNEISLGPVNVPIDSWLVTTSPGNTEETVICYALQIRRK